MQENPLLRLILTSFFRLLFRVEVVGQENIEAAGDRVVIIANHISFLDPSMIGAFMPETPSYAINIFQADKWYFRWMEKVFTLYRLDPSKPLSMKRLIQDLRPNANEGGRRRVVIFPEGRISTSSGIMKIYEGTGLVVEKTGATVLPVRVDGAEYSKVSRLGKLLHQRWFPKIRLTFLPPVTFEPGRHISSSDIYDLMTKAAFDATPCNRSYLDAALNSYSLHGGGHLVISDVTRSDLSYRQLLTRAFIISGKLRSTLDGQLHVGIMLPNAAVTPITFIAMHMLGKIPCMLNYTAGKANLLHACHISTVKTVLTSRSFVEKGKLEHLIDAIKDKYTIIYLEDLRPTVMLQDKIYGLLKSYFPRTALGNVLSTTSPDSPAVILYTSGSEGVPKGVALSHKNILSNVAQFSARIDLNTSDIIFNALPVFHSFGLTAGMLMPLLRGIKVFLYPTPLHYRIIPDLVYDTDATIMLGTDTFYNGYAHYAHPYDFWNIRLAVAGAEKLREPTRRLYADKFHMTILEGYGVTESSPVVSINTPMEHKVGSVGRPLSSIECLTQPIDGLDKGGRLLLKGPNIMLGYIKEDKPGIIQPQGEWYDTGDIVEIDEEGYIHILGRAKRFAKIGGEMVSLMVTEDLAIHLYPEHGHASIAVADDRKGEQIVLFSEAKALERDQLLARAREIGITELALPKLVVFIESIPRLGNGKIDYVQLNADWAQKQ